MATCNAYPKFEANQVLTAEQLNRVVAYLRDQDLLTRRKLIGIGPYCGLIVRHTSGAAPSLHISSGCGITSNGDLVTLTFSDVTRYRKYEDPVGYSLFYSGAEQVNLWELRTATETTADDGSQPLSAAFLQKKIVLLYLECREVDLKTCTGDDCDEKGIRVETCVKKLAVDMADADVIIQNARNKAPEFNQAYSAKYKLPQVRIGRSFDLLKLGARITAADLAQYYQGLMAPLLDDLSQAYDLSYQTYAALLRDEYNQNPFDAVYLRKTLDQIIHNNSQRYQYVYDFLKDLLDAYDEFRLTVFDLSAECCPDPAHFPKHLMLGPAIADETCEPSTYCQHFVPAPLFNRQGQLRDQCRLLFKKMALLLKSFKVPVYQNDQIRITPSAGVSQPLSRRAMPFYYNDAATLHKFWNFNLTRLCKADHQLSYYAGSYAPKKLAFVHDTLAFEWDVFSFLRVEGHIGGKYADVSAEIEILIRRYNLPVQLVGLKLDTHKGFVLPDFRVFEDFRSRLNQAADALGLKRDDIDVLLDSDRLMSKMGLSTTARPELVKSLKTVSIISPKPVLQPLIQPFDSLSSIGKIQPLGPVAQPPQITGSLLEKTTDTKIPACRYQDLEAIYAALRSELVCLLEKETQFFGNLKFDDKEKTYTEGVTGFTGSILDLKGQPLQNAEITILDSRFKNAVAKGTTAIDGTFDIKDLQPGKYYVDVKFGELEISRELVDIQDKQTLGINYRFEAVIPKETGDEKISVASEAFPQIKTAARPMAVKAATVDSTPKGTATLTDSAPLTGFMQTAVPLTTLQVSKTAVLAKGLSQLATKNTIGEFYKELDKSVLREDELNFSYDFFSKYPFASRTKIPEVFAKQIKSPLKLLATFDQLDKSLPDTLVAFDYAVFEKNYQAMVSAAGNYRTQVIKDLSELSQELKGNEDEILIHLDHLLAACSLEKFRVLDEIYTERKTKLENLIRFAAFIQEHPGIEHLAGVPKGGTLIIVYDTNDIVVADFCLPYICCSECPPVTVGAPIPVVFKLPRSEFCKSDPRQYKVITNVPGETVIGPGIDVDETTGDSYFRPAADDVPLGTVRWTYVVQHQTYTFEARIIEADATFNHEVTVDEIDPNRAMASFTATTTDADIYSWNFGDGSETSSDQNPNHTYTLSNSKQTVDVTLTIHRDFCINSHTESIVLPAGAVEPLEIGIDSPEGTTEFCSDDENRYALLLSPADPEGKVISSGGGIDFEEGTYFFAPSAADSKVGPVELSYVIGSRSAGLTVQLLNPQASFIAGEPQEKSPGTYQVAFTNTSANADTFEWTFEDGQTSSEVEPVMTFSDVSAGQEIGVTLTVSFAGKCARTSEGLIKIPTPTELSISFENNKTRFCKRQDLEYPVIVDPADPTGLVTGEGVEPLESGFSFNPSRTATSFGPITLTYSIGDSSVPLTVYLLNPTAGFTIAEPKKRSTGVYEVQFTNTSTNANAYAWTFGDGQSSSAVSPLITYKDVVPGQVLQVTLTASFKGECPHKREGTVTIPLDLSISLKNRVFCRWDEGPHDILVQPEDPVGEVTGPGVGFDKQKNRFVFIPSDDKVVVGKNILTYRIGSRSTSTAVTVAKPVAGFTAEFSRPNSKTFHVQLKNTSTEAKTFRWSILPPRMATPIITTEREPALDLLDTKPGDLLSVRLEASYGGRCPHTAVDEKIVLPDIPPETVPPQSKIDVLKMIDNDLTRLQRMPRDGLFEVTFKSTSNPVFAGTLEFLSGLKNDLADPAEFTRYQKGVRNDKIAKKFDSLFKGLAEMIRSFKGLTAPEQRQYVTIVVRMLAELLISLTAIQHNDLATGSALFGTLNNTVEMISALMKMRVRIDPDGGFALLLAAAQTATKDKPNVLQLLKRFSELIR